MRGIAPGVTLRAYRVFGRNAQGASNFAIAKAIDRAVEFTVERLNGEDGTGAAETCVRYQRWQGVWQHCEV